MCNQFGSHWILFQFYNYGLLVYDSYIKVLNFPRFGKWFHNKCGIYSISVFIYYILVIVLRDVTAKIDRNIKNGQGAPNLRIQGQSCHKIGSLLPPVGEVLKFAQLYIYDTENETHNMIQSSRLTFSI